MKIINPQVQADLAAGHGLRLNLGSGERQIDGFYNLDCTLATRPDIFANLNDPLSLLPDSCVHAVYARHTFEHVENLLGLMAELHRVCRPDAWLEITVPHFSNPYGYSDPTHVRYFGLYSFFYFSDPADQPKRKVPSFYSPSRFRVERVSFRLLKQSLFEKCARTVLEPLINRSIGWLDWYERRLCRLLPVSDVRYVLRPRKNQSVAQAA